MNQNVTPTPVGYEVRDGVAFVTLEAGSYNILTCAVMEALSAAVDRAAADLDLTALVLRARGKAFSAGADVGEHAPEKAGDLIVAFGDLFRRLYALEVPLVMAVHGPALGAGFELAMMADVLLATEDATFGQPEIRLAFFAPVGVALLPALIGRARATEIICSGRTYPAHEMQRFGLVSRVVPAAELDDAVETVLKDFRKASPRILRMNVELIKRLEGQAFPEALSHAESIFLEELMKTEDVREGIASFLEKRKPVWKNR